MSRESYGGYDPRWTPAWKRLRKECFERDKARGARCVHCGQPIDYTVRASTTDDSYEPDHRITVEKHPEYALFLVHPKADGIVEPVRLATYSHGSPSCRNDRAKNQPYQKRCYKDTDDPVTHVPA